MGKQIFILNSPSGNSGVVKAVENGKNLKLLFSLNKELSGRNRCYIISGENYVPAGIVSKSKNTLEIYNEENIDGIFLTPETSENIIAWSGEKPPEIKSPEIKEEVTTPELLTFDNLFGGGFDWHRIRGNFIMFDYSIVHHVLSGKNIYPTINRAGYYCAGIRKQEDLTLIAIAFPVVNELENPFAGINADTYSIYKGNKEFIAICVGIDKTGEFFLSI